MITIAEVNGGALLAEVRTLFLEYADWTGLDLSFQGFDHELATLPGDYARPGGRLLLARDGGKSAGCVAMRPLRSHRASSSGESISPARTESTTDRSCEMKRFFVRNEFRGRGVGRILATRIIDEARQAGYSRMVLDTLPTMAAAIALYELLGFRDTAPYTHNPVAGARFLELVLSPS